MFSRVCLFRSSQCFLRSNLRGGGTRTSPPPLITTNNRHFQTTAFNLIQSGDSDSFRNNYSSGGGDEKVRDLRNRLKMSLDQESEWNPSHRRRQNHDDNLARRFEQFERKYKKEESNMFLEDLNWEHLEVEPFVKGTYSPDPLTSERSEEEIDAFRKENRIAIIKGNPEEIKPILTFPETGNIFPPKALNQIRKNGFQSPMPIQAQGWPIALSGKDMIGIGETGSGKTLGFLLPALTHIQNQPEPVGNEKSPVVLIMSPTRELAQQTNNVIRNYSYIPSACLVGGTHKGIQIRDLDRGADIVVATPGRLIDLISGDIINLKRTSYVVLDEADRMLDMGFEPAIRQILGQIRPDKQMLLWSATWPKEVQELSEDFVSEDHVHLNIGSTELQANKNISQTVIVCENFEKDKKMFEYLNSLNDEDLSKILVFAETQKRVDRVERLLKRIGFNAQGIHGGKTQSARSSILSNFKRGTTQALVATNVAARGLDVDDIKVVINYDYPNESEEYIHRIGRTGRRGNKGKSLTLFNEEMNAHGAASLMSVLIEANQEVPDELIKIVNRKNRIEKKSKYNKSRKKSNQY